MNFKRSNLRPKDLVIPRSHATRNLLLGFARSHLRRLFALAEHRLARRGGLQPVCSCLCRGGVYPARRREAPSARFVGLPRLGPRQGTAFDSEARRAAAPNAYYLLHRALAPEAATRWPRPRLTTNLSSRAAMRRGICFSFLASLNAPKLQKPSPARHQ